MESVQVKIFGQFYSVKGMDDHAYIRELADFVDHKMNEIKRGATTSDSHRIAILTALTISDELFKLRKQCFLMEEELQRTATRLVELSETLPAGRH
jgi:cell division protein ZapA